MVEWKWNFIAFSLRAHCDKWNYHYSYHIIQYLKILDLVTLITFCEVLSIHLFILLFVLKFYLYQYYLLVNTLSRYIF